MSTLEFIANMTGSLAWPLILLAVVLVFRRSIRQLLTQGWLKRIKAGPFEAEWERLVAETEEKVKAASSPDEIPSPPDESVTTEFAFEASTAPAVAVLDAYAAVERQLRSMLDGVEHTTNTAKKGAVSLARLAARHELISPASLRAVEGISVLRNLAAHGEAREVTSDRAAEYLALVDGVLFAIGEDYRKALERRGPDASS
jgi:hypothetical protein